jgi:hypothetical protein
VLANPNFRLADNTPIISSLGGSKCHTFKVTPEELHGSLLLPLMVRLLAPKLPPPDQDRKPHASP